MLEFPSTINVLSHWIQLFISLFVTQADALASERNILLMTVHSVFSRMTSQYNVSRLHTVCAAGFCPLNPSKPLKILQSLRKYFFFKFPLLTVYKRQTYCAILIIQIRRHTYEKFFCTRLVWRVTWCPIKPRTCAWYWASPGHWMVSSHHTAGRPNQINWQK